MRKFHLPKLSLLAFSALVSGLTLVLYNIPVFQFAWEHANFDMFPKVALLVSLVIIMLVLNFMAAYLVLFLTRWVGRLVLSITLLINAVAEYFVYNYSTILDDSMLGNVFNTRYSEASEFFSWGLVGYVLLFGLLPVVWVFLQPLDFGKAKRMGIVVGGSLGTSVLLILLNLNQTLWIGNYDTELGGLAMPWSYVVNTARLASMRQYQEKAEILLPDATVANQEKTAVVLVIGESARKANFQLYGYQRANNPLLAKQEGLYVLQAQSCATYTTAGVRAILEPKDEGDLYEILPNYLFRTGVDVSWRTGNWGEPPVHVDEYLDRVALGKLHPADDQEMDGILFQDIRQRIESSTQNKVLIIIHTSTSHGPDYTIRVPKDFWQFQPVLEDVEKAEKEKDKLINSYDNSVLYTDFLLSNLIDSLRELKDWHSAMLFVSDHGESLGENKMFMHGVPMKMAPKEQYEIPFMVWLSPNFRTLKKDMGLVDQHYVFHSVLNLLSVQSPAYQSEHDIFQQPETK